MTTAKNPADGKTEPTKPEVDKNPADGKTEPTKPETKLADKKPEPVVRHHVQHEAGGQQGSDAPTMIAKWATAGLAVLAFIALALALAWGVSSYMNKASAPAVATITPPAPPPRMVDVSPPDPSVTYTPTPAPVPDPLYVPTVRKTGKDNWGNSIVTKPTFAEGSK